MRRDSTRGLVGFVGCLLVASALALPTVGAAQNVCTGLFNVDQSGPDFAVVGSVYTVTLNLGAGTISGADPAFLIINRVRFELDCANVSFVGCTDEGQIIGFNGNLSDENCVDTGGNDIDFTATSHTPPNDTDPNEVIFTPTAPVRIFEGSSPLIAGACTLQFDVIVNSSPGTDASPLQVQEATGYREAPFNDAVCSNGLTTGAQSTLSISLCQTTCGEGDTDCETFACDQVTGECVGTPVAASTACDEVAGTECTNPGCDGAGNCVATHLPKQDSTPCTDNSLDCFNAGCEAGVCVQAHTPVAASTTCDEVAGTECANPGCDGAGNCVATHLPKQDSTPCTDNSLDCFNAGCEAGTCVQAHTPVAASTTCDEVAGTECANPGCDGAGNCVATHLPKQDSTPCTDNSLDCFNAGCEAGTCVQAHTPVAASTVCDEVAGTECANPGCDGAGTCVATHLPKQDSTECADIDNNPCSVAGCEAGVCEQVHACEPDGKAECEITIGDFIWNDGNGDGLQDSEPGINLVDLDLIECVNGENVVSTFKTAGGGIYGFTVSAVTNLETCVPESRDLKIDVVDGNFAPGGPLNGFTGSPQNVGPNDAVDSDCDPTTHETACEEFAAGETDLNVDCGFVPEANECITHTPGFWCTHPTVTDLFLDPPLTVCGLALNNVQVATAGSAIEDVTPGGNDFKAANTSPQQLHLIRQCTAAALNQAASLENEGDCEGTPLNSSSFGDVFQECCTELCPGATAAEIDGSGCIGLLDTFNNSEDTFVTVPPPFASLGTATCPIPDGATPTLTDRCNAQSDRCNLANGNGFVNPRTLGPGSGGGGGGKPPKNK